MCNGARDCPGGEDEMACRTGHTCTGMVRCRSELCVSRDQVCDGIRHCPDGDDELVCNRSQCVPGCSCLGYSMLCDGVAVTESNLTGWEIINTHGSLKQWPRLNQSVDLFILNLSSNFISNIIFHEGVMWHSLSVVDISHNNVRAIGKAGFIV